MNRFGKYCFFVSNLILTYALRAQDYHYAQFDAIPLNVNPSFIGDRQADEGAGIRMNGAFREQRSNFTSRSNAYRSASFGIDFITSNKFSSGAFFANSKSVYNVFSVTHFNYGFSYKLVGKNESSQANQQLAVGVQVGMINSSFSPAAFTFDQQYAPSLGGFDLSLPSGENFQGSIHLGFSGNAGVLYKAGVNEGRLNIVTGASIYNISRSTERFNGKLMPAPLRYNAHFMATYRLDERVTLVPQALFMYQNAAQELNVGSLLYYALSSTNRLIFGLNWRQKNALILQGGVRLGTITFRASYCIVNSYLSDYNNRGLEVTLSYTGSKKQPNQLPPKEEKSTPAE